MPAEYEVPAFHRPPPVRRPASLNLAVRVPVPSAPRRPCLVVRAEGEETAAATVVVQSQLEQPADLSPTRNKKRVVFADDAGRQLTHVKVCSKVALESFSFSRSVPAALTDSLPSRCRS